MSCCQSRLLRAKRETSRAQNRTNLTEANLRYHPLKASALDPAGGRTTEIIIDHFDL